jgi:ribosome-associated protein
MLTVSRHMGRGGVEVRGQHNMPPTDEGDSPTTLNLRGEYITLAHALKAAALADTGGQAKHLVRSGAVTVNGAGESQPGRKLRAGDRFGIAGGPEWTIT